MNRKENLLWAHYEWAAAHAKDKHLKRVAEWKLEMFYAKQRTSRGK